MRNKYTPKKIGVIALFISIGLVLQYIEGRILITSVPGGKLGLANMVSISNMFLLGGKNAVIVSLVRSLLGSMLTGGAAVVPYSIAGAVASTVAMWGIKKLFYPKISIVGISIVGAVVHNGTQLVVAGISSGTVYVCSYLGGLLVLALISGLLTGYATRILSERVFREDIF